MTSKYLKLNISATTGLIFLKFETNSQGTKLNYTETSTEDDLKWKTTQSIKNGKSQQALI